MGEEKKPEGKKPSTQVISDAGGIPSEEKIGKI